MPTTADNTFSGERIATGAAKQLAAPVLTTAAKAKIEHFRRLATPGGFLYNELSLLFNDPVRAAIRSGLSKPELIKRFGKNYLSAPLIGKISGAAAAKKMLKTLGPIGVTADIAMSNLPTIKNLGRLVGGSGSLKDVQDSFIETGRDALRGSSYNTALRGGADASPARLFSRYAIDAIINPGVVGNEIAVGASDTVKANEGLNRTMNYGVANAAGTSAVRAGQALKGIYGKPGSGGLTLKDIYHMSNLGARSKLLKGTRSEPGLVRHFLQSRMPPALQKAVIGRTKLHNKVRRMSPSIRSLVEKKTGYHVPEAPAQRPAWLHGITDARLIP